MDIAVDLDETHNTSQALIEKKNMKIQYLEKENASLKQSLQDMSTTLKINKQIINNLLQQKKGYNSCVEYTFNQLTHENELLENKLDKQQE